MSALVFRPRKKQKQVGINVTPLIDVLFLFIIFFVLTGTFKRVGELELRLPESATASPLAGETEPEQVELIVTEDGRLLLDGDPVAKADLKRRLAALLDTEPDLRILIKAETEVQHGEVVVLLDIVRQAGFPGVGIGTYRRPPS